MSITFPLNFVLPGLEISKEASEESNLGNSLKGTNLDAVVVPVLESAHSAALSVSHRIQSICPKKVTAKRQQTDSTLLTLYPASVILESETVRPGTLCGRVRLQPSPQG